LSFTDEVEELARRRGFYWPSYEIYGGVGGLYDIGPNGLRVKQKIENLWRHHFLRGSGFAMVEIETPLVTPERVLEASGHVDSFTDPLVVCPNCHRVYRADQLAQEKLGVKTEGMTLDELRDLYKKNEIKCEACGTRLLDVQYFNLLFQTHIGPFTSDLGFLRPETAQGIFTAFKRVYESERRRLPMGVAQVGRVARNEISPRQGLLRMREFTIMEFEFFFDPERGPDPSDFVQKKVKVRWANGESSVENIGSLIESGFLKSPWMGYFMASTLDFMESLGFSADEVTFLEKGERERAHYSAQTFDVVVPTKRWGEVEVAGIAYRTDYDLRRHSQFSGEDLSVSVQLPAPEKRKVVSVKLNRAAIGKRFGERAEDVMKAIYAAAESMRTGSEVASADSGSLKVQTSFGTLELGQEYVKVEVSEELVSTKKVFPHVVEPSFGADRLLYVLLDHGLKEKEGRRVLSLPAAVAPYDVAVFPLIQENGMVKKAVEVLDALRGAGFDALYDEDGTIGRRYARVDEIGVPWAVTVDELSVRGKGVTVRERDTWKQWRVDEARLAEVLSAMKAGKGAGELGLAEERTGGEARKKGREGREREKSW